jgi:hypothetical protein
MDFQIVSEQPSLEGQRLDRLGLRLRDWRVPQHPALHDEDVEVAVVVVVEQCDARCHELGVEELAGHAVEMDECQARCFGAFREPLRVARDVY